MRVLHLTTSYPQHPEDPGGAFVAELSETLSELGHESTVLALPLTQPLEALSQRRFCAITSALASQWFQALLVDADIVLAHWIFPSACVAAAAGHTKVVGVAHGGDVRLIAARPALRRPTLRTLSGLIAVSSQHVASLGYRGPTLLQPMGVRLADVGPVAPLPPPPLRLLFIGRDDPIKGLSTLVRAVGETRATLTVAGVTGASTSSVRYLGSVPLSARRELLATHHVLCVPSRAGEGAPRVVAEAYGAGRAVLASHVGGLPDLVPDDYLVPPGDVAAWAARIRRLTLAPAPVDPERVGWGQIGPRVARFLHRIVDGGVQT